VFVIKDHIHYHPVFLVGDLLLYDDAIVVADDDVDDAVGVDDVDYRKNGKNWVLLYFHFHFHWIHVIVEMMTMIMCYC